MTPVGFRFRPTEEEIICHYLKHKLNGRDSLVDDHIGEADLYRQDPWELPDSARIKSDDRVWYFFCRLDYKYSNSKRANRTTKNGFWKLTGKVRDIKARGTDEVIGTKKTLVFQYRCPDSKKVVGTSWVIHEFQAKTSSTDQRPLVLCKLKHKACDLAANLHSDDGEPSRVMGSNVENNAVQSNIQEVDEQLQSLIDSHGVDFDFPFALQPQNHPQNSLSDQEIGFADSFLTDPDEHGAENPAYLFLNDFIQSRPSRRAYVEDSSDRGATHLAYGESSNLYVGHGSSKEYRQMQMAHDDEILLMGASSRGSTTATRNEQINLIESSFMEHEGVSATGDQLQGGILSTASKHKVREGAKQVANIDPPEKVGVESEKDMKIVQVLNARPVVSSRSNESVGNERRGRFIHLETTTSSHRSSPPSVYLLNTVLGLVLLLIMLREVLVVH